MKSKLKDNGQRIWKMMLKASVTLSENSEKQIVKLLQVVNMTSLFYQIAQNTKAIILVSNWSQWKALRYTGHDFLQNTYIFSKL